MPRDPLSDLDLLAALPADIDAGSAAVRAESLARRVASLARDALDLGPFRSVDAAAIAADAPSLLSRSIDGAVIADCQVTWL